MSIVIENPSKYLVSLQKVSQDGLIQVKPDSEHFVKDLHPKYLVELQSLAHIISYRESDGSDLSTVPNLETDTPDNLDNETVADKATDVESSASESDDDSELSKESEDLVKIYTEDELNAMHYKTVDSVARELNLSTEGDKYETIKLILEAQSAN